ncbi:hypothetical protein D3OALGA1CA_2517 [Olavius algarvensis associated proteobacterium Delta 3]|nr:hypothetical protein D3OALGA1CA_2517 [Olavius algarvensis associated proteobacterium Delta 3]CAB5137478.1 hypothetical protein D3OALGB2SA_4023 [Olavius algarvensis associated proteobacterium Delta 3]
MVVIAVAETMFRQVSREGSSLMKRNSLLKGPITGRTWIAP